MADIGPLSRMTHLAQMIASRKQLNHAFAFDTLAVLIPSAGVAAQNF